MNKFLKIKFVKLSFFEPFNFIVLYLNLFEISGLIKLRTLDLINFEKFSFTFKY